MNFLWKVVVTTAAVLYLFSSRSSIKQWLIFCPHSFREAQQILLMEKVLVPFFTANDCILLLIVRMGRDGWWCILSTFGLLQLSEFASWPLLLVINQISLKNAGLRRLDNGHVNISEFLVLLFWCECFYLGIVERKYIPRLVCVPSSHKEPCSRHSLWLWCLCSVITLYSEELSVNWEHSFINLCHS